jgi:hypothetical protein
MATKRKMTENSRKVLDFLKQAGVGVAFTTKDVQTALGFEKAGCVTGSVTGLVKKDYAERFTETVETEDGKVKEIKKFALTEKGMAFDPDAEVEED